VNPESVLMQWSKLGAAFNVPPVDSTPDIEQLLIDTAIALPDNARLFPVVVSWLCKNYRLVCKHRLSAFTARITDPHASASLGLLLDIVKSKLDIDHFNIVINKCKPLKEPLPLFAVDRISKSLIEMAQQSACKLGIKWGLFCQDVQLKDDVIKSSNWIISENSTLRNRAVFNGNLRASILETLVYDKQAGQSESSLARCCGVTRKALREALDHLEFCQLVHRISIASRVTIMLQ
jgi:hypothetical protein